MKQGDPVLVTTCHLTDPSVFELTSLMGFDGIWMDLEHHGYSVETATNLMRAARVGTSDIMARPAKGEFMRLGRLLEAGAQGIMYPRCDDAAEAREVVRWSKFAPLGSRGYDSGNPDNPYVTLPFEEYVKQANQETFLVIQIESPDALERADEIAAVEGIDVLFFGPSDFSLLSGIPGQFDHPKIEDATNSTVREFRFNDKSPWPESADGLGPSLVLIHPASNPDHDDDLNRSADLSDFRPLLDVEGSRFYSLQVGDPAGDIERQGFSNAVVDLGTGFEDFTDTAAAIQALDLVISVDTAVPHLAGAMGKPVWLLLPRVPDWRWFLDGDETPWYPTMRLFRQTGEQDWRPVIEHLAAELAGFSKDAG